MATCLTISGGCLVITGGCLGAIQYVQARFCASPFTAVNFGMTTTDAASFPGVFTTPAFREALVFGTASTPTPTFSIYTTADATNSTANCSTTNSAHCFSFSGTTASTYSLPLISGLALNATSPSSICCQIAHRVDGSGDTPVPSTFTINLGETSAVDYKYTDGYRVSISFNLSFQSTATTPSCTFLRLIVRYNWECNAGVHVGVAITYLHFLSSATDGPPRRFYLFSISEDCSPTSGVPLYIDLSP